MALGGANEQVENAAESLALRGDGQHFIPLDNCIRVMLETGRDMGVEYKGTSQRGIAVNQPDVDLFQKENGGFRALRTGGNAASRSITVSIFAMASPTRSSD